MSLRAPTRRDDPFVFWHLIRDRESIAHRRGRPHGEPFPAVVWGLVTVALWALAAIITLLSVAFFGASRNGLWLVAVILYVGGVVALLNTWRRMP